MATSDAEGRTGAVPAAPVGRAGSPHDAIGAAYAAHARTIHRYLARRVGVDLADDLTADTFAAALAGWQNYDHTAGEVLPWLYGIAGNKLARHRRREIAGYRALARRGIDPVAEEGGQARFVDADSAQHRVRLLAGALAELPDFDRDVLLLTAWEGLTYTRAAQALGSTTDHVRSRLHRARTFLRSYEEKNP